MSDLTKRLPYRLRVHYNMTADAIAEEAADRIEALEECLREVLETWTSAPIRHFEDALAKARALLEEK